MWAFALLIVCFFGIRTILRRTPSQWVDITVQNPNRADQPTQQVGTALELFTKNATDDRSATVIPLARIVAANGSIIDLNAIDVTFENDGITPIEVWKKVGSDVLLVNSVDEYLSSWADSAIALKILAGCGILAPKTTADVHIPPSLHIGGVNTIQCGGRYHDKFNVNWLANVAVIVGPAGAGVEKECKKDDKGVPDSTCIAPALHAALAKLFDTDLPDKQPMAVVMPSIATGNGQLPPATFYEILQKELVVRLRATTSSTKYILPRTLYLNLWSHGDPDKREQARLGISMLVAYLVSDWRSNHDPHLADWPSVAGVSGGLAVLLIISCATQLGLLEVVGGQSLTARPVWFLVIGWFLGSFAVAKILGPLLAVLPESSYPWTEVGLAFVAVFVCGPVVRITKEFDELLRKTHAD